jgi:predicted small lipoprotein YifL
MSIRVMDRRVIAATLALATVTALAACGGKPPPAPVSTAAIAPQAAAPEAAPVAAADTVPAAWTAEALEELLAPVALYPDPVLSQVLIASTNPQEVLDAGNWLLTQEGVTGKALDDAAAGIGFTPPVRALVQFPETVDMMCLEMGWTTELGEAFVADQAGVLDAVQRLRLQAQDVGNLQSSEQMLVETQVQEGKEVVVLKPAKPDVVYVPQYDPATAYAPLPPAATTATTTTTTEKAGHSTGSMIATGVLAFGAGILVNELFDDDDDNRNGYYYPNYGYGGMPYYPPYPYRPSYGGGFYPNNSYNRPPNYNSGFQNNGNIIIAGGGGGNRPGNNYWDRYDNNQRPGVNNTGYKQPRKASPISATKPNRPELNDLNKRQPRPMPQDVKRPSANTTASNWKGQSGYAGKDKRPASAKTPQERINAATPAYTKPASSANARPGGQAKVPPKVQGSYAGKRPETRDMQKPAQANRDVQRPKPQQQAQTRDMQKPAQGSREVQKPKQQRPTNVGAGDRGHATNKQGASGGAAKPMPANRPPTGAQGGGANRGTAMSGANRGNADRAASQRGKQSMPQGARSKGGGGGGGGKKQAR